MTRRRPLPTLPITDSVRDGAYQLVVDADGHFALVRWDGERWVFSSGVPLDFEPDSYLMTEAGHG